MDAHPLHINDARARLASGFAARYPRAVPRREKPSAAPLIPPSPTLETLRAVAAGCQACDLYQRATQTVFGAGRPDARIVFVGEQPGNDEDKQGEPFVGPAGRLLDSCLVEAGIDRTQCYVTNAVKHFKWEPRGKRRLHQKPNATEIFACNPWLKAELSLVPAKVVVCLGATAAQAILGKEFRVTKSRGQLLPFGEARALATVHPSSILRAPDKDSYLAAKTQFIGDLKIVADYLRE
jgi:DNA polymerase